MLSRHSSPSPGPRDQHRDAPEDHLLKLRGTAASPGCATGPAFVLEPTVIAPARSEALSPDTTEHECARLVAAIEQARRELSAQQDTATGDTADILAAHLLMLTDPVLHDTALERVRAGGIRAENALTETVSEIARSLRSLDDEYLRGRAVDVEDVGRRIARWLQRASTVNIPAGSVVVARDIAPSDVLAAREAGATGVVLEAGATNSHALILARSLGLPAVIAVAGLLSSVTDGDLIEVDGNSGEITIGETVPASAPVAAGRATPSATRSSAPPVTRTTDGRVVRLYANVGQTADVGVALAAGAEGVGVVRTEFLFLDEPPSEQDQYEVYREMADRLAGKPLVIRTLDAGGDKPLPYLPVAPEANPYLGLRGLRLSLAHTEVFRTQLRAILRAAVHGRIMLMYPMVTNAEEIALANEQLLAARTELAASGEEAGDVAVGAMIEVPAAALRAEALARHAAFLSVGTNDLAQYTLAADRNNAAVSYLYSQTHPAVLRLIQATVTGAHRRGRPVAICGEVAGDVDALPLLIGLDVDELSVAPHSLERVRAAIASLSYPECVARTEAHLRDV